MNQKLTAQDGIKPDLNKSFASSGRSVGIRHTSLDNVYESCKHAAPTRNFSTVLNVKPHPLLELIETAARSYVL
jgi:hypothetical protein